MSPKQRIRELFAQLMRAESATVIQTVAAQLQIAIDEYVRSKQEDPLFELAPANAEPQ
jgi:hypothetical protein